MSRHRWSEDDELIAYCLYRQLLVDVSSPQEWGELLGMGWASLDMKIRNFSYLDGKGSLEGYSKRAERVFVKYRENTDDKLLLLGLPAALRAGEWYLTRLKLNRDRLQLEIDEMEAA